MLKEFGGGLELTKNWDQSVLGSINCTRRRDTTGKVELSNKFLEEEKFTFQRKVSSVMLVLIYVRACS